MAIPLPRGQHGAHRMSKVRIRVLGDRQLRLTFERLPKAVGVTVLTQAARKGAVPIRNAARDFAPRGRTGNLRREIVERVIETSPTSVEVGISWRRGKWSRTPAFYGLFVHEGTKQRVRIGRKSRAAGRLGKGRKAAFARSGGATGRLRPNPFLTRAYDSERGRAERIVKAEMLRALRMVLRSG